MMGGTVMPLYTVVSGFFKDGWIAAGEASA